METQDSESEAKFNSVVDQSDVRARGTKPKLLAPEQWTKEYVEKVVFPHFPLLSQGISGKLGGVVFFTDRGGKTSVRNLPRPRQGKPGKAELARRARFKKAAAYAKRALADPEKGQIYVDGARGKDMSPYNLSVQGYLRPPVIDYIGTTWYTGGRGEIISVGISNTVPVARVRVVLRSAKGRVLEQGNVRRREIGNHCNYVARKTLRLGQTIQIEATATDHARHSSSLAVLHELRVRSRPPRGQRKLRIRPPRRQWFPVI